jgi:hypothetical protein
LLVDYRKRNTPTQGKESEVSKKKKGKEAEGVATYFNLTAPSPSLHV